MRSLVRPFLVVLLLAAAGARADEPSWRGAAARLQGPAEERAALLAAYEERGGLLWLRDGKPTAQAQALAGLLSRAGEQGLEADEYGSAGARLAPAWLLPEEGRADRDVAFSAAVLAFANDLVRGRVEPRAVKWRLGVDRPAPLDGKGLLSLADAADPAAALDALQTPFAVYRRTRAALVRYLALAARGDGPALPAWKGAVSPGDAAEGLDRLAARLALLGDLTEEAPAPERYEGPLVDAVARFQLRHGLQPTGLVDRETRRALAVPLAARAAQLARSLERMRWLPRSLAPPLLVVNIPGFELHALAPAGAPSLEMRVVVGRAYQHHHTPVFLGAVEAVRFHPYWNVPEKLAREELLPGFAGRPGRAEAQGFELVDAFEQPRPLKFPLSEEVLAALASGALRLRQRPGVYNALGPVKFDMPNPFTVYLHGTPSSRLFSRWRRDYSHGCIRVEDPAALAAWTLAGTPGWDAVRVQAALAAGEHLRVPLATPLPVLILYATAVAAKDGRVSFYRDLYGNDALLERALARSSAARRARLSPAPRQL
jgi:murein L,D-transpeptidase YcbB/YkuD